MDHNFFGNLRVGCEGQMKTDYGFCCCIECILGRVDSVVACALGMLLFLDSFTVVGRI